MQANVPPNAGLQNGFWNEFISVFMKCPHPYSHPYSHLYSHLYSHRYRSREQPQSRRPFLLFQDHQFIMLSQNNGRFLILMATLGFRTSHIRTVSTIVMNLFLFSGFLRLRVTLRSRKIFPKLPTLAISVTWESHHVVLVAEAVRPQCSVWALTLHRRSPIGSDMLSCRILQGIHH